MTLEEEIARLPIMDRISAMCQMCVAEELGKQAQCGTRKAELELKTAENMAERLKNFQRPSILLSAQIAREGKKYTASAVGLVVEGDTPEMAFDNFDHAWTYGENDG